MADNTIQRAAIDIRPDNHQSNEAAKSNGAREAEGAPPLPQTIVKRDGRIVPFDIGRIENAISRCFNSLGRQPAKSVQDLAREAVNIIAAKRTQPTVEEVQDIVEMVLQAAGEYEAAKHYILYRAEHAKMRKQRPIPEHVRAAFAASDAYFPTVLQKFQFYDKYARFSYELGRRETWVETVDRAVNYLRELSESRLPDETYERIRQGILTMRVMPSMRLLAMAGPAARRSNITIYNCSYMPVIDIYTFVEALTISMSGCGVGFSVERQYVERFPRIHRQIGGTPRKWVVADSAEGWAEALRIGLETWFDGGDIQFDYSQVRPAGSPLRTKGGRASGPEPLRQMLDFTRARILARQGSFLRPIDAHDIMCVVGNAAVSGGVRRTAMISLFDFDDLEMRLCKSGDNIIGNEQRWNANNSAVWPDRELTQAEVARFMLDMVESGRGEPGIFSRQAALNTKPARRAPAEFGTNPCAEIVLRPFEFCNLSIAVARPDDTEETLREKVELASIIGTIQSMATHFPGLRPEWKRNCEEERLLGVDINGQMDSPVARDPDVQERLRHVAVETNRRTAEALGINPSAAVTCVKPSGNSSQLLDCSPGLHARWAPYYIRNVRVSAHTPMFKVLRDAGVPMDPENGQMPENASTWVIHFPVRSPEGAITRKDRSALEQCEYWLQCKTRWTEHNPSCFTGDMRFITNEGLRRFDEFEDGAAVVVLNARGEWTEATVRALGNQEIWELEVERCGVRHTIRTTADHLWPVSYPMRRFQGRRPHLLRTDQLDRIIGSSQWKLQTVNPKEHPELDLEGVLHGITFGDGTRHKSYEGRREFCQVYLCNDPNGVDSRKLAVLFEEAGYRAIDREDHEQIRIYALPQHWKTLPTVNASPEYLRGFVAGWFAADGHIDLRGGQMLLSSTDLKALEWLQTVASRAGLAVSTRIQEHTNDSSSFGPTHWYTLSLVKETLDQNFFLLEEKLDRFTTPKFAKHWKVVSVRNTRHVMPVYCVEEPREHLFVLEGNILTHNCTITYRPNEVLDLIKWVWEHQSVIGGMSFLPAFDAQYAQMPYVEIEREEYERLAAAFPDVDFSKIYRYEEEDLTTAAQELACSAGVCELTP